MRESGSNARFSWRRRRRSMRPPPSGCCGDGSVTQAGLDGATIEEYVLGPSINLNFFYSPVLRELELMGTDTRRQTNLEGFRNLPPAGFEALRDVPMRMEEAGHIAATMTESMLERAFDLGERFVTAARAAGPPGAIGPFALQCIIAAGPPKSLVCYDVSLRIPGSPGTRVYALFRLSLGPRRVGRRANCDGNRDGPRRKPAGRGYNVTPHYGGKMTAQSTQERAGAVTFKGQPMTLQGPELHAGDPAPDFHLVAADMAPVNLDTLTDGGARAALLIVVPSLDTNVCSLESNTFNRRLGELPQGVRAWVVSEDLPFAQTRWAGAQEGDVGLSMLSDYRDHSFGLNYGLMIAELKLLARAIVVIGKDKTVKYVELVREVGDQPNYDAALKAAGEAA